MNVLYHLTVPPSPMADCDAVVQEVKALQRHIGSWHTNHLYPGRKPGTRFPRRWWGIQTIRTIRKADKQVDLHHIFNPDPYPFAILKALQKPVVYTAVAGIGHSSQQQVQTLAQQVHTLILPTEADKEQCQQWDIQNVTVAGPIIDISQFQHTPPPAGTPFTLLMASAPWTAPQFQSKGVDALLTAAEQDPSLHLIFLWRGVLYDEMQQRIHNANLQDRVQVINKQVNVNEMLAHAHAAVLFVTDRSLIKAHPHSLLESLAAGKPVLVSNLLPLAKMVTETSCGLVTTEVTADAILQMVDTLTLDYDKYQGAAETAVHTHFQSPLNQYQAIYTQAIEGIHTP
ncbi:MAG: glycosyltransferase [Chloroflexi bacterium]|nr:glycosyltransferase [Chloroflexota bacterium]